MARVVVIGPPLVGLCVKDEGPCALGGKDKEPIRPRRQRLPVDGDLVRDGEDGRFVGSGRPSVGSDSKGHLHRVPLKDDLGRSVGQIIEGVHQPFLVQPCFRLYADP